MRYCGLGFGFGLYSQLLVGRMRGLSLIGPVDVDSWVIGLNWTVTSASSALYNQTF
jgi:hypothetical protein